MNFTILITDTGGFTVIWTNKDGFELGQIGGFATHEAAQGFIQDLIIKLAKSSQKVN